MAEKQTKRTVFLEGFRDGIPIALGYFAVAFSLGIAARNAGLTAFQGFIASTLCVASAGEYALFTMIGAGATYLETAILTLITNARYFLMSCAMSQKIDPKMPNAHRYLFGAGVTDEIFAITIARPGRLEPMYNYGAMAVSVPAWAVGTALGIPSDEKKPCHRPVRDRGLCFQLGRGSVSAAERRHAHHRSHGGAVVSGGAAVPERGGERRCVTGYISSWPSR